MNNNKELLNASALDPPMTCHDLEGEPWSEIIICL